MVKDKSMYLDLMEITAWQLRQKPCLTEGKEKELLSNIFKALSVEEVPIPIIYSLNKILLYPALKKKFWEVCLS